jgi:hypothetical protein
VEKSSDAEALFSVNKKEPTGKFSWGEAIP